MHWDLDILFFLNNLTGHSPIFDTIVIYVASYLQYIAIALFIFLLYLSTYRHAFKIQIFLTTLAAVIISRLAIVELIRLFYQRPRPYITHSLHALLTSGDWSFPSGHAAFFFALAAVLFFYNKRWGVLFTIFAFLISVSRVIGGVHYPSDILGGALIGILSGYMVFTLSNRHHR